MEEIRLRSKKDREPMTDERLRMLLDYAAGITAEILGFALAFVIVLCMAGVLRQEGDMTTICVNGAKITVQDCIDMFEKKDMCTVLNDGVVIGFAKD